MGGFQYYNKFFYKNDYNIWLYYLIINWDILMNSIIIVIYNMIYIENTHKINIYDV
jgi:hypothetical protein